MTTFEVLEVGDPCACGCGEPARPGNRFLHGHNAYKPDLLGRFMAKVVWNGDEDECWTWEGGKDAKGYGRAYFNGRIETAHRVAHELFVGPIPDRLVIDHLCRNLACVNPGHLEPVTQSENLKRGELGARKAAA